MMMNWVSNTANPSLFKIKNHIFIKKYLKLFVYKKNCCTFASDK